jgi:hypothetical protein
MSTFYKLLEIERGGYALKEFGNGIARYGNPNVRFAASARSQASWIPRPGADTNTKSSESFHTFPSACMVRGSIVASTIPEELRLSSLLTHEKLSLEAIYCILYTQDASWRQRRGCVPKALFTSVVRV